MKQKMTKTEFLNAYTALDINVQVWSSYEAGRPHTRRIPLETEIEVKRDYIEVEWLIGGRDGGNCWGDDADNPVEADPEKAFEDLDKLLEVVAPRMTFLMYKKLCREIVKTDTRHDSEYYGNYYEYATKRVYMDELYDWLSKNNLLTSGV
jgi:hypothetical protein